MTTQTDMVATVLEDVIGETNVVEEEDPLVRTKIVVRPPKSSRGDINSCGGGCGGSGGSGGARIYTGAR